MNMHDNILADSNMLGNSKNSMGGKNEKLEGLQSNLLKKKVKKQVLTLVCQVLHILSCVGTF